MCNHQGRRQSHGTLYWHKYSAWSYGLNLRLVHHRDALGCLETPASLDCLAVRCALTTRSTSPADNLNDDRT